MTILNFDEFIEEGLWSKGVERSMTGDARQEDKDKIFYQPNVYPVTGYSGWFFELTYFGGWKNNKCVSVYKKPDEKFKYSYYGIKTKPNKRWMIVDKHNGGSNVSPGSDDYILVHSNEFIDAINNDMNNLPVKAFKFMEVVKEGLWSKGVDRSKTGDLRQGDLIKSNIGELKEVDLFGDKCPFYFSDKDFEMEGKYEIKYEQFKENEKNLNLKGWRLPTLEDIKQTIDEDTWNSLEKNLDFGHDGKQPVRHITYTNPDNGESLTFYNIPATYPKFYILDTVYEINKIWVMSVGENTIGHTQLGLLKGIHYVRLIKDK